MIDNGILSIESDALSQTTFGDVIDEFAAKKLRP
jgi:hypothetical protein